MSTIIMCPNPKVSIIIPTKNRCESLQEAVDSIRAQTYSNWEVLVVDDQSTDQTVERVLELAASEPRIRLIQREGSRGGAPVCRNLGFCASTGQHIIFLDSDDLLAPTCLEQRVTAIVADPELDFIVFRAEMFHSQPGDTQFLFNRDTGEDDLDRFLRYDTPWQTASPLWRRAAVAKVGPWDEDLLSAQDIHFSVRALVKGMKYQRFPVRDLYIRESTRGETRIGINSRGVEHLYSQQRRLEKLYHLLEDSGELTANRRVLLVGNYFWVAGHWMNHSMLWEAVRTWKKCRRKGLITQWTYLQGLCYLCMGKRWFSSLPYYYLWHRWPADMFIYTRGTNRKTPLEYETNAQPADSQAKRVAPRFHREIVQDGWLAYLGRRLMPTRIFRSLMYRLRKWQWIS